MNGKWMNVSEFAGGYTAQFARQVLREQRSTCKRAGEERSLQKDEVAPEEDLSEEEAYQGEKGKEDAETT